MRAQLRTYHSIPSLQAQRDPNSYKQLQDAPRLKSILKGASDDRPEPDTIEKLKDAKVPRTNPVNVIFICSKYSPFVTDLHFDPGEDFFDIIMRETWTSKSRARAFLWIMWWYLESDFSEEACHKNPFGEGRAPEGGGIPQRVPLFDTLTADEAEKENCDTPEEAEFAKIKMEERRRCNEAEQKFIGVAPRRGRKRLDIIAHTSGDDTRQMSEDGGIGISGADDTPAPSAATDRKPRGSRTRQVQRVSNADPNGTESEGGSPSRNDTATHKFIAVDSPAGSSSGRVGRGGRWANRINDTTPGAGERTGRSSRKSLLRTNSSNNAPQRNQTPDSTALVGVAAGGPATGQATFASPDVNRRARLTNSHQAAVDRNRQQRVEYILDRKLQRGYSRHDKRRITEGAIFRALKRCSAPISAGLRSDSGAYANYLSDEEIETRDSNDTEPEDGKVDGTLRAANGALCTGPSGIMPLDEEGDDWGFEVGLYAAALRRTVRRMDRWEKQGGRIRKSPAADGGDEGVKQKRKRGKVDEDEDGAVDGEAENVLDDEDDAEDEADADEMDVD
jgi:Ino eighty subunit 1